LHLCQYCFKYMCEGTRCLDHQLQCTVMSPPGRKVYERGASALWEVSAKCAKLYCQCLSLFGKFFLPVKTIFFDLDDFTFYVLTEGNVTHDRPVGYFSKELCSAHGYNVSCLVVFPPYRSKGYGSLLIEFSYELSRRARIIGTPERPLSHQGLRSYLRVWVGMIIRFSRSVPS
ncbi:acyl-CoA N-acyltransferase, partial [Coprinopsis sp. MPI-PUGE-AT-0042]